MLGGKQPVQIERVALGLGERGALVQQRIGQQFITGKRSLKESFRCVGGGHICHGKPPTGAWFNLMIVDGAKEAYYMNLESAQRGYWCADAC